MDSLPLCDLERPVYTGKALLKAVSGHAVVAQNVCVWDLRTTLPVGHLSHDRAELFLTVKDTQEHGETHADGNSSGLDTHQCSPLSRVLLCDPVDGSPPGSCVHGISQARILERVVVSSSRGSS